ncbi:MAG: nitrogenase component 1, partial [bacterium]
MIPTLRKSGITPDQKMRIQLYSMLEPQSPEEKSFENRHLPAGNPKNLPTHKNINHIGSNLPIHQCSELLPWLTANGICLTSLHDCHSFDDYLAMANASANVYYEPLAAMAAKDLEKRLGQEAFYLPFVFDREGLRENYQMLADKLSIPLPDTRPFEEAAKQALRHAKNVIGDTPIVVDYTFTFRILNFTRMLLSHGFHVTEVYADSFLPEEEADFHWIREHFPEIAIWSTNRPKMRFAERGRGNAETPCRLLAIGQKAAYFTGTDYFVNVAESGGYYGFGGIREIARLM